MGLSKIGFTKSKQHNAQYMSNIQSAHQYTHKVATSRSMSNKRLLATAFSLLLGLFLAYSSFFYFPAYYTSESYIKVTKRDDSMRINENKVEDSNPYLNYLLLNQGYLKAAQTVIVNYEIFAGPPLEITILNCSGPVIVEIYSCRGTPVQTILADTNSGRFHLTVSDDGFYKFEVKLQDTSDLNSEYKVTWMRK